MTVNPRLILSVLALIPLSSCSTVRPKPQARQGFFERIYAKSAPTREPTRSDKVHAGETPPPSAAGRWRWPVTRVEVTSGFGRRWGGAHEGVDLRAPSGTPVVAANDGKVLYAGRKIAGYGNMVVIRHGFGFSTVYAHNSKLMVRRGQRVKCGQRIALSGATGKASGPHLHFELRHGTEAVDPFKVLVQPGRRIAKID